MNKRYFYKMQFSLICLLIFGAILLLAQNSWATRLKIAVLAPQRTIWGRKMGVWAKDVKKKTAGKVKIKIYYGGIQGDEVKVVRLMKIGRLHGAGFMARGISKVCPDSLVFAIPLMFHSEDEAIWVQEKMQDYLQQQARSRGYEILGWTRQGFTYCFSQVKMDSIALLRQSKPWMLEKDAFCESFFRLNHIAAIPAPVGDVMVALQSGMIRTVFAPPIGMLIMQWQSRVKYQLSTGLFYSFGAVVLNKKQWDKISQNNQAIIRKSFLKNNRALNVAIKQQNASALRVLHKKMTVLVPTPKNLQELYAVTEKVENEMNGKAFSRKSMELAKAYLKEYRAHQAGKNISKKN